MNYKEIIENLDREKIKKLFYQLGVEEIEERDNCLVANTICHNISGGSKKLYFYDDTKIFMCYTSCGGMNIFKFLEHYYKNRDIDYDWYEDIYLVARDCSIEKSIEGFEIKKYEKLSDRYRKDKKIELSSYSKGVLDIFTKFYPSEWLTDGITKKAMDKFNILYSISQNKIIIPHYDVKGNLVGVRGRALNEEEIEYAKYAPVKIENKFYSHKLSLNLYGLYENQENIRKNGYVYVFESELRSYLFFH